MGGSKPKKSKKYNDKWIRDWTKKAEKREKDYKADIKFNKQTDINQTKLINSLSGDIDNLTQFNQDRIGEILSLQEADKGFASDLAGLQTSFSDLEKLVNTPTTTGDVTGLDDIISNLQSQYSSSANDISNLQSGIGGLQTGLSDLQTSTKTQLDEAIAGLGINDYLKTSDFDTRMNQNLGALSDTLTEQFGQDIAALNLDKVRQDIAGAQGDLSTLTQDFAGISSDMDWIKQLDLGSFDDRLTTQATNLSNQITGAEDRFSGLLSSTEDRFANLLGGQTGNLTNLINESEQRLQQDLGAAATDRQGLRSDLATGLQQGAAAREGLRSDLATGLQQGTTARERLAQELSSGLQQGSEARQALAQQLSDQGYSIDNLSTQLLGYRNDLTDYQNQFRDDLTDLRGIVGSERELELGKLEAEIGQDRTADLLKLRQGIEAGTTSEIERMAGNLRQEYGDQIFDLTDTFGKGQEENRLARQQLGADIQDLFGRSLAQDVSVAGLTSNVGTLSQNLDSLRTSFGDFQADAASNLGDVQRALQSEIGDLSGSLTSGLASVQTDYIDRILGSERAGAAAREDLRSQLTEALGSEAAAREDLRSTLTEALGSESAAREGLRSDLTGALGSEAAAREAGLASEAEARQLGLASEAAARQSGLATEAAARQSGLASEAEARQSGLATEAAARQSGLATEASAREAGLQSAQEERTRLAQEASRGFQDVYKTREQAISELSGRFGENLRAQEATLSRRIDDTTRAVDEKIGRLGSMMNYRMLGDSAGGVKMRRSKAYKSGAINTGTGQLKRSMKLKTLNI